jgi:hypothetical protein
MGEKARLSNDLRSILNQQGIYFLNQVSREPRSGAMGKNWITCNELRIEGPLVVEWKNYRDMILNLGV